MVAVFGLKSKPLDFFRKDGPQQATTQTGDRMESFTGKTNRRLQPPTIRSETQRFDRKIREKIKVQLSLYRVAVFSF